MRPDLYERVNFLKGVANSSVPEIKGKINFLLKTITDKDKSLSVVEGHVRVLDEINELDLLGQRAVADSGNSFIEKLLDNFEKSAIAGLQNNLSKG